MLHHLKFVFFSFVVPFFLIHLLIKHIYGLGFGTVLWTLLTNYLEITRSQDLGSHGVLMFLFLIFGLLFLFPFGGLLDSLYLEAFGERQELVYVGEKSDGSVYINQNDSAKLIAGETIRRSNNLDGIYKSAVFLQDPLYRGYTGKHISSLSLMAYFRNFLFAAACFSTVALAFLYVYVHPAYDFIYQHAEHPSATETLTQFTQQWGVDQRQFAGSVLIGFMLTIIVVLLLGIAKRNRVDKQAIPLPYLANKTLMGLPTETEQIWESVRVRDGDSYRSESRPTPRYKIFFKIGHPFPIPIYLYDIINIEDEPELFEQIQNNTRNATPVAIEFNERNYIDVVRHAD